ncbi:MAG TPA: DEAD/DEAH box helicase, partial [Patescibacteria group bacterium]|nr:DEAD/DEAH box helicase [Patescibacteria group bacterium]
GFAPQIKKILQVVPKTRQTMLFSATMPDGIVRIATGHMKLPVRVEMARAGTAAEKVVQELFVVRREAKNRLLDKLLSDYHGTVLVFSRTKHGARKICHAVKDMGHRAAEIHSDRSLFQRREALDGFKSGKYRVLVATDIAARGIDVVGIEVVINYDLPDNPEDYVHRIGRKGRAGLAGRAISFATHEQGSEVRQIEKLVRFMLPISKLPELPPDRPVTREPVRSFAGSASRSFSSGSSRPSRGFSQSRRRPSFGGRRPYGGRRESERE